MSEAEDRKIQLKVCYRCLLRLETGAGGVDLPRRIRETLAAHGLGDRAKVMTTGCLAYCPVGLVSVMIRRLDALDDTHVRLIDPEQDGKELVEHLGGDLEPAPSKLP
jgi:predicted metal-binding protein